MWLDTSEHNIRRKPSGKADIVGGLGKRDDYQLMLSKAHCNALRWFSNHTGDVESYVTLVEHQPMTRTKGIHEPAGSSQALSIRLVSGFPYSAYDLLKTSLLKVRVQSWFFFWLLREDLDTS